MAADAAYTKVFQEIVPKVWQQKVAERERLRIQSQHRLSDLQSRKRKLLEALLDDRISKPVYDEEMATVGTAINAMLAGGEDQSSSSQQLGRLLHFAELMMDRLAGLWNADPLHLKIRLQSALFPDGIKVSQERFGTGLIPVFCSAFQPIPIAETSLASLVDQNWNQILANLKVLYDLRYALKPALSASRD